MTARRTWVVHGTLVSVYDGDTLHVDLDLGWDLWLLNRRVRLAGVNAPELSVDAGPVARDFLRALVGPGAPLTVTSHGLDKYGRVLAEVAAGDVDLSQALLAAGHAAPYALEDQLTA